MSEQKDIDILSGIWADGKILQLEINIVKTKMQELLSEVAKLEDVIRVKEVQLTNLLIRVDNVDTNTPQLRDIKRLLAHALSK